MLVDTDILLAATQFAGFSIATTSVFLTVASQNQTLAKIYLASLFAVLALSELSSVIELVVLQVPGMVRDMLRTVSFVGAFLIAPLLMLYVRLLIAPARPGQSAKLLVALFVLPALALLVGGIFLFLPETERFAIFGGGVFHTFSLGAQIVTLSFIVLELLIHFQWITCVLWIFLAQKKHVEVLREHFASTTGMEMRWSTVVAGTLGFYACFSLSDFVARLLFDLDLIGEQLDSYLILLLVIIMSMWGLRPSFSMQRAATELKQSKSTSSKYEKSALGPVQADRIARKLASAMCDDKLYRDPNLTLSALSAHISVSSNYVSQTLNESLRQSFFEFVNSWRIEEAIPLVLEGQKSVTEIAYEVGFNSRSSFYTAFKLKTGHTPSSYKNNSKLRANFDS